MKKKNGYIIAILSVMILLIGGLAFKSVYAYFSADSSVSGTITMGHLYIDDIVPSGSTSTGWDITNLQPNQSFGGSYSVDVTSDINYYTRILFKASVTPLAGKTHADGCGDKVADPTDILNISIDGTTADTYQKSNTKTSDGYTAYYKLSPTTAESETTTETFNIDLKVYDWVGNGYCDYYMGATVSINMYVQVMQADYLEGNSIGDISSASDMHELWNEIVPPPILDVTEYSNLTFTVLSADDKTMSVKKANTSITEANIPAYVKKDGEVYTVTQIVRQGFLNCYNLTSVTIPNSVTSIASSAFENCDNLTSVVIENGVTSIEYGAFYGCTGLTSIDIPGSVTSIGSSAFEDCTNLSSVVIGNGVTSIASSAFEGCRNLTAINVNSANTAYSSIDGVLFDKEATKLILCPRSKTGSCTIPSSVTSISTSMFEYCARLTAINVDSNHTTYSSIDGVVFNKDATEIVLYPRGKTGSYTIPSSVTSIGDRAFYNRGRLTSITIPSSVTSIGSSAFSGCTGLTSITIPSGVTIGNSAFYQCTGLTSITIPSTVTSIGSFAFSGCRGLTSIVIESSVVGEAMFYGCTGLTSITIPSGVTSIGRSAFSKCSALTSIDIPSTVTSIGGGRLPIVQV